MIVHPFDRVARDYDRSFTQNRIGRLQREAVRDQLHAFLRPGTEVLELACGTGEDALWLVEHGSRVTATDTATAMLDLTQEKAKRAGVTGLVRTIPLELSDIDEQGAAIPPSEAADGCYDGILSNFGGLNCLEDRRPLAAGLGRRVRPGGWVALVLMNPVCPWEIIWFAAHGQFQKALRRFRKGSLASLTGGGQIQVWYPGPGHLRVEFSPLFQHVRTVGIGVWLPPPYLEHLTQRWPAVFDRLAVWDRKIGKRFPFNRLSDHYLSIFRRR